MANPSSIKESYMENYSPINISYIVQIGNGGADDVLWALTAWQMPVHIEARVAYEIISTDQFDEGHLEQVIA